MADDDDDGEKASGGITDDQSNLDDAQGGKNTALRTRAQASQLAADQRKDSTAYQGMTQRAFNTGPGGRTMRSTRWYDKSGP